MLLIIKKYSGIIFLLLVLTVFWSALFSPAIAPVLVIAAILFSLVISISSILEKHKGTENQRQKIGADILILIVVLVLALLLGGWSGLWAGKQAEGQFGAVIGVLCALTVSFAVGYLVQKGMRKLVK